MRNELATKAEEIQSSGGPAKPEGKRYRLEEIKDEQVRNFAEEREANHATLEMSTESNQGRAHLWSVATKHGKVEAIQVGPYIVSQESEEFGALKLGLFEEWDCVG